jgi:hypothetical protein
MSMKRVLSWGVAFIMILGMLGCSVSGPTYQSAIKTIPALKSDLGRIYFYRESGFKGSAIRPAIHINDKPIKLEGDSWGRSAPGGFFYVDRPAGKYVISCSTEVSRKLSLTLAPGQTRYVRTKLGWGVFVGRAYPELVEPAVGRREIAECHFMGREVPAGN